MNQNSAINNSFSSNDHELGLKMVFRTMIDQKNLLIFGDENSGKSSFVTRFLINHFYTDKQDFMDQDIRKMMRFIN